VQICQDSAGDTPIKGTVYLANETQDVTINAFINCDKGYPLPTQLKFVPDSCGHGNFELRYEMNPSERQCRQSRTR
jgi:hypothetical protein